MIFKSWFFRLIWPLECLILMILMVTKYHANLLRHSTLSLLSMVEFFYSLKINMILKIPNKTFLRITLYHNQKGVNQENKGPNYTTYFMIKRNLQHICDQKATFACFFIQTISHIQIGYQNFEISWREWTDGHNLERKCEIPPKQTSEWNNNVPGQADTGS